MSNKAINVSKKDFLAVHNGFLNDNRLMLGEIGLLAFMLSRPSDYDFSAEIVAQDRKMETCEVNSILTSLNKKGYFRQIKLVDRYGKFVDWAYEVSDEAHPEWIGESPVERA